MRDFISFDRLESRVLLSGEGAGLSEALGNPGYGDTDVVANGALEHRISLDSRHFLTVIEQSGALVIRPHPGVDVNGWGSSLYLQPFLPGATLAHTSPVVVTPGASGVEVAASGSVSMGAGGTYGTWSLDLTFAYDPSAKSISGTGAYSISLAGQLGPATGDLNLYRIASNYLENVPLVCGFSGDTGDMDYATVVGGSFNYQWHPPTMSSWYPTDATDSFSVDVTGRLNNVLQNGVTPAYKPSLAVVLTSHDPGIPMTFGAQYDTGQSQNFAADNVGITPLVLKSSLLTSYAFDVSFSSRALPKDGAGPSTVSTVPTVLTYIVNGVAAPVDPLMTVTDVPGATLACATAQITSGYRPGEDVLGMSAQPGITASFDAGAGTLSLRGTAAVAAYQAALRSVTFLDSSGAPHLASRIVTFSVNDGYLTSNLSGRAVSVTQSDAREPNNSSWLAAPLAMDASGSASSAGLTVYGAGDADWFSFTVPYGATGAVEVDLTNVGQGLNARLGLYDSALGSLSDMYGGIYTTLFGPKTTAAAPGANQAAALNWTGLKGGATYYVEARGLSGTTGVYDIRVAAAMMAPDADEPNDSSGAATNVTSALVAGSGAFSQSGLSIHRAADEDWFRIDAPANADGNLTAAVSGLTGGLAGIVWVYQRFAWGTAPVALGVYASWMPGGAGQAVVYNAQPNATYFVRVDNFSTETGGYRLDVTLPLDLVTKDAHESGAGNNASWLASPLTLAGNQVAVSGLTIHSIADQDWFSFTPTSNGNVQVTVSGVSGGLIAHAGMYDSVLGTLSDQYGGIFTTLFGPKAASDATSANETVTLNFSGLRAYTTYYVKVSGLGNTTGLYTLGIQFTPTGNVLDDALPAV